VSAVVEITRVYHFSAGHRLVNFALSGEENAALYGRCARPHGHNYYLEVTLVGSPHPSTGMAVDLGSVDRAVQRAVLDAVDHETLEQVPALVGVITTGESLARAFWAILARELPAGRLTRVAVHETANNQFEYWGGAA
jgi:6-pyruvoyltetrahydropterin/6-carboxytetrahydropterin synthase